MAKSATKKLIQEDQVSDYKSLSHAYAKTKHAAEMEVWRGSQEGLEVVVVRPGVILGAGFWKSGTGRLFERINKGLLFYTEGVTGYVSVEDVTNAMILLIETNCFGKAFTLVAENRSFKSIFFQMAHSLKASQPKYLAKKWMTSLFWRIEMVKSCVTGKEPKLTKHTAKAIHGSSCFAAEEVKKAINFQFEPIDACIKRVSELYLLEN
jgi:nucleoside-diphosphate-sugar epimerase